MGRIGTRKPTNRFGEWLLDEIEKRGWERKTLAIKSGVSNTHVNQMIAGERKASRDIIGKLVVALAGEDADESIGRNLLNAGMRAAGFAVESDGYSDPLETIVAEVGFDSTEFSDEEKVQMRRSVDAVVIGLVEQQRRERMKKRGGT